MYGGVEVQFAVHVPFGVENVVAEAGFQFCGHRAGTFVYFDLFLCIDESEYVVTGNRMTTVHELILSDVVVSDEDGLLAVELFRYDEQAHLLLLVVLVFVRLDERHILAPSLAFLRLGFLAFEHVEVAITEQYGPFAQCLQKTLAFRNVVYGGQLVGGGVGVLYVVLFEKGTQSLLSALLCFSAVAPQYGFNLCFGLCRGCKVYP